MLLVLLERPVRPESHSRRTRPVAHTIDPDRASDITASRKMGTYYLAALLFKTYFRVRGSRATSPLLWQLIYRLTRSSTRRRYARTSSAVSAPPTSLPSPRSLAPTKSPTSTTWPYLRSCEKTTQMLRTGSGRRSRCATTG